MKIAIGLDNAAVLHKGHFGDSPLFAVYEINGAKVQKIEERNNPFIVEEDGKGHHGKVKNITAFLPDCEIFLATAFGLHSILKLQHRIKAVWLTRTEEVSQVVQALQRKDTTPFLQFDFSIKKFVPLQNFALLDER